VIAVDTNALRHYLRGRIDSYTPVVAQAVNNGDAALPPIVLTEALSEVHLAPAEIDETVRIALLPLFDGYWFRAGNLRRDLLAIKRSAPLGDCLIAQACIDADVPLLTYDSGFTRFLSFGLKLYEV